MNTSETFDRDAAVIEADISRRRESLDRKLQEIERRLSPKQRLAEVRAKLDGGLADVRAKLDGAPVAAWGAAAAVAAGSLMAVSGLRRNRHTRATAPDDSTAMDDSVLGGVTCE